MKRVSILLVLCALMNACSRPLPIDVEIERDDAKIKVVAKQVETSRGIQQTLISTVELTVAEDGTVRSNEGDEWKTLDDAIEDSKRMAKASLEATIAGLKDKDRE